MNLKSCCGISEISGSIGNGLLKGLTISYVIGEDTLACNDSDT
jgi:hypothetical protein